MLRRMPKAQPRSIVMLNDDGRSFTPAGVVGGWRRVYDIDLTEEPSRAVSGASFTTADGVVWNVTDDVQLNASFAMGTGLVIVPNIFVSGALAAFHTAMQNLSPKFGRQFRFWVHATYAGAVPSSGENYALLEYRPADDGLTNNDRVGVGWHPATYNSPVEQVISQQYGDGSGTANISPVAFGDDVLMIEVSRPANYWASMGTYGADFPEPGVMHEVGSFGTNGPAWGFRTAGGGTGALQMFFLRSCPEVQTVTVKRILVETI